MNCKKLEDSRKKHLKNSTSMKSVLNENTIILNSLDLLGKELVISTSVPWPPSPYYNKKVRRKKKSLPIGSLGRAFKSWFDIRLQQQTSKLLVYLVGSRI